MKIYDTFGMEVKSNTEDGKISGIYTLISNVTGICYIGFSCNIRKRWSNHIAKLRKGTHGYNELQDAWDNGHLEFTFIYGASKEMGRSEEDFIFWYTQEEEGFAEGYKILNKNMVSTYSYDRKNFNYKNQSGESNGNNKYSLDTIKNIKQLIKEGYKNREISEKTGIKANYIAQIKSGYKWDSIKICEELQ